MVYVPLGVAHSVPENLAYHIRRAVDLLQSDRMTNIELAEAVYPVYTAGGYQAFVGACRDAGIAPPTKGWVSRLASVWKFWALDVGYSKEQLARASVNRLYAVAKAYAKGHLSNLDEAFRMAVSADDATFNKYVSAGKEEEQDWVAIKVPALIHEALLEAAEYVAQAVRHPLTIVSFLEVIVEVAKGIPQETWLNIWGELHGEAEKA